MKNNYITNIKSLNKSFSILIFIFHVSLISIFGKINYSFAKTKINNGAMSKIEKAIVYIEPRFSMSLYQRTDPENGSGFINDKKNGLIVTNNHVIGGASVGSYFVTFYNGRQIQAKVIYYDIWQDYAILKVDPKEIPKKCQEIQFSKDNVTQNQKVFVIGCPGQKEFGMTEGHVSELYSIGTRFMMPQSSYTIHANDPVGGARGSPIINEKLEAVGVLYFGYRNGIEALRGQYVQNALNSIKNSQNSPQRKHCGAICDLYSLHDAVKHRKFPEKIMEEYINKFPEAENKAISVSSTLKGTPAEKALQPGDIIWEIEGKQIGGNLYNFDYGMDSSDKDNVTLTVFRNGEIIKIDIGLYNINNNKIERMVYFGGATFFELDDICSFKSGLPIKSLSISNNVESGSSFSVIPVAYRTGNINDPIIFWDDYNVLVINSINEKELKNLNDLIEIIPEAIGKRFINIKIKSLQSPRDPLYIWSQEELIYDIVLDSIDDKPRILRYDYEAKEWISENLEQTPSAKKIDLEEFRDKEQGDKL